MKIRMTLAPLQISFISNMSVDYQALNGQLSALLAGEEDALAKSANFAGLLYGEITDINWLGIYVLRDDEFVQARSRGCPHALVLPSAIIRGSS